MTPFAVVLALASGLAAFLIACGGIRVCLPFPDVPSISPKYRYISAHKDDYDVLFVGSSRFYHQIIPKQFDALVGEAGGPKVRSFNCAYDGMWPPESYYFIRRLLDLHPGRLRWIVIDAMEINPELDDPEGRTMREAYWHDFQHTRMALEQILEAKEKKPGDRPRMIADHLLMFVQKAVNFGRGSEMMSGVLGPLRQRPAAPPVWSNAEGYHGLDKAMPAADLANFERVVGKLSKGLAPVKMGAAFTKAMANLSGEIRKAGAEPVYVIAPTVNWRENYTGLPGNVTLIAFNDPAKYPQLYDPSVHYDAWHLNTTGAKEFTRLLADRFLAALKPAAGEGAPKAP